MAFLIGLQPLLFHLLPQSSIRPFGLQPLPFGPQPLPFSSPEDLLGKLRPNEDGVLLHIGPRTATFLPQVWAQLPDKAEFLNHLSQKAGCESSAWRGKDVSVSIYHVEGFEEEHARP